MFLDMIAIFLFVTITCLFKFIIITNSLTKGIHVALCFTLPGCYWLNTGDGSVLSRLIGLHVNFPSSAVFRPINLSTFENLPCHRAIITIITFTDWHTSRFFFCLFVSTSVHRWFFDFSAPDFGSDLFDYNGNPPVYAVRSLLLLCRIADL